MKAILATAVLLLGVCAAATFAHHPFDAEFDWKRPVTVTGTVAKFEWREPHPIIEIKGKDEKGTDGQWTVELGDTAELQRIGWSRTQLKAGDQVNIDGWLAKNGTRRLSAKSVTLSGGRELFAASSFFDVARPTARTRGQDRETTATTGQEPARQPRR